MAAPRQKLARGSAKNGGAPARWSRAAAWRQRRHQQNSS